MATVTAISTKGSGGGKATLSYISRDDKTENGRWVTALNCTTATAYDEFKNTKQLYKKTSGIQYYHFVQSHPKGYDISPELAHKIAVEFSERTFKGFECVVATHTDADHIHSHIVFNSVSFEDGHKYHSNKFTLNGLRELSDEICIKYGVSTLDKLDLKRQTNGITTGEYRTAMKGQSWKMDLMNTIDLVMKQARSQKDFCRLMKNKGYSVRWEEQRKYITYTCPDGKNAGTTSCTKKNTGRRIWSVNSRLEEMRRASQESAEKALDTSQATIVFDSNWKALIGLTKQNSDTLLEILDLQGELMQRQDMSYLLGRIEEEHQQTILEQKNVLQQLTSQAGKLNEQYSTQMKQLEEFKHKLRVRIWTVVLASQAGLAILLMGLGLWLR